MKLILEQVGGAFLYMIAGSGICGMMLWVIGQFSSF